VCPFNVAVAIAYTVLLRFVTLMNRVVVLVDRVNARA
jgi:hypothetical protein